MLEQRAAFHGRMAGRTGLCELLESDPKSFWPFDRCWREQEAGLDEPYAWVEAAKAIREELCTPDLKHYFTESKEEELPLRRAIPRSKEEETLPQTVLYSRRVSPRVEADDSVYVHWSSDSEEELSHVQNLNLGGIFIETSARIDLSAHLELNFLVSEGQIRAKAVVRHVRPSRGLGLKFTALNDQDRLRFGALMKRQYLARCAVRPVEPD